MRQPYFYLGGGPIIMSSYYDVIYVRGGGKVEVTLRNNS